MKASQTLERGLDILFTLTEAGRTLSIPEIAEKVSLPESTTYRFIQSLEYKGVVERKGQGQIGIGFKMLEIARSLTQQIDYELSVISYPFMEDLTKESGETTVLTVRSGLNVVVIQKVESPHLIRMTVEEGKTLPLFEGASGKAILSFENKKIIDETLSNIKHTGQDDNLKLQIEEIRNNGYALTIGEVDEDVIGIAAPIFNRYNQVIASLTIAGPSARISEQQRLSYSKSLVNTVRKITEKISGNHKT